MPLNALLFMLLTTSYFSIAASLRKKPKTLNSSKTDGVYVSSGNDTLGELRILFILSNKGCSRALSPFVILSQMYLSRGDHSLSYFEIRKMSLE